MKTFKTFLREEYTTAFKPSYNSQYLENGILEIFKNPSKKELTLVFNKFDSTRGFINLNGNVYMWQPEILHHTVQEETTEIDKDAISFILHKEYNNKYSFTVTDYVQLTKWNHNPNIINEIKNNVYLNKMFNITGIYYYDEDIVGDWNNL